MSEQKRPPRTHGPMGHGPGAAAIPGEKAHDFKGTIKKLLLYLGKYKLAIALVLFFAVLSASSVNGTPVASMEQPPIRISV